MAAPDARRGWRIPVKARRPYYVSTEWLRDTLVTLDDRRNLQQVRAGRPLCWDPEQEPDEPLVTVRIATYNTGRLAVERAISSAIAQTYENIEILVIGDRCDDASVAEIDKVDDPRLRFINLPARGLYPEIPNLRRKVAGAHPMNVGNILARGAWIAPCDDDDVMTADHVEVLLSAARRGPYEFVWSKAEKEIAPDEYGVTGSEPLRQGEISHGTILMRSELRFMAYSLTCWKRREPADWNLWRRMRRVGVEMAFFDRITYRHHLSDALRTQFDRQHSSTPGDEPAGR